MADVPLLGGQRIAAAQFEWIINVGGEVSAQYIGGDGFAHADGLTVGASLTANGFATAEMTLSREINNIDCAILATSVPRDDPDHPGDFQHVQVQARPAGLHGESTPHILITAFFPNNYPKTNLTQRIFVTVFRLNRG